MRRQRRGFTLIELLVVVAIIALLISILLPSLSNARRQARTTKCMANLKSICTATAVYLTEDNGFFPGTNTNIAGRDGRYTGGWVSAWYPRLRRVMSPAESVESFPIPRERQRDPLPPDAYGNGVKIFWCPENTEEYWWRPRFIARGSLGGPVLQNLLGYAPNEYPVEVGFTEDTQQGLSYGMADWGSQEGWEDGWYNTQYGIVRNETWTSGEYDRWPEERNVAGVARPAEFYYIMDSQGDFIYDDVVDPTDDQSVAEEQPSKRHNGFTVTSFADQHVEKLNWLDLVPTAPPHADWAADGSEDYKARRWNFDFKAHR